MLSVSSLFSRALLPVLALHASGLTAFSLDTVPQPALDLGNLGQVGIAGDFDAISIYSYKDQDERSLLPEGSSSIYGRLPDGGFAPLVSSDATIEAICPYTLENGTTVAVVGGNFTSLGGVKTKGIALFDPETKKVTPVNGLDGKVSTLLCDNENGLVYVGGDFTANKASSNAVAWSLENGWVELPFEGFDGPVRTITQDGNKIVFGGEFEGLGNSTKPRGSHSQTLNLQSAAILGEQTNFARPGFDNPTNVVCSDKSDSPGNAWLLADGQRGAWRADFKFGFKPTKIRLYNTHLEGRGTKLFSLTAFPINGLMNLSYVDPEDKRTKYCENWCPLSDRTDIEFQDFEFVNVIGMNSFKIDIKEFYGPGAGLRGIEVFQDDIFTFAVQDNNEPTCAIGGEARASSSFEGPWTVSPFQDTDSGYLVADLAQTQLDSARVVFNPYIQNGGRYRVSVFTPGCIGDGTCQRRGRVTITGSVRPGENIEPTTIFQTNNFDKYDRVYEGIVDTADGAFRPSITLTPSPDQGGNSVVSIVAQKVFFEQLSGRTGSNNNNGAAGGGDLNGIYEFNTDEPEQFSNFEDSPISSSGSLLDASAKVFSVIQSGNRLFVAGSFRSGSNLNNIYEVTDGEAKALAENGLNGAVSSIVAQGDVLYVGGNFTNTQRGGARGINFVASYSLRENRWVPLGAGLNGRVHDIVPLKLNVSNTEENVLVFSGDFTRISEGDEAKGIAVWVPSKNEWLPKAGDAAFSNSGALVVNTDYANGQRLYAGSLASSAILSDGAVTLTNEKRLTLRPIPIERIAESDLKRRGLAEQNKKGVVTGLFHVHENPKRNLTILGGHFSVEGEDAAVNNLVVIDRADGDKVSGVGNQLNSSSVFLSLHIPKDTDVLYAGGSLDGTVEGSEVRGLISWDFATKTFSRVQPAPLNGPSVVVRSIVSQPNTKRIFVGGAFDSAGSLTCPSLCIYDRDAQQWNRPAAGVSGSISTMKWIDSDQLMISGNMTLNNTATYIAIYNAREAIWLPFNGVNADIPGPIKSMAFDSDKGETVFISGKDTTAGTSFLRKWNGQEWKEINGALKNNSEIENIQVLKLSKNHKSNPFLKDNHILLVTGALTLDTTTCSSALFDGNEWTPFLLTAKTSGNSGFVSSFFSENEETFRGRDGKLARGFIILIALAISLALVFLIVLAGILASYIRRRREGYTPMPTKPGLEKSRLQERVPPQSLFGSIGPGGMQGRNTPMI